MKLFAFLFILLTFTCYSQPTAANDPTLLYDQFATAYDQLSPEKLADLYTGNGEIINLYDNSLAVSLKGREEIKNSFIDFFDSTRSRNQKLQITFKITYRRKVGESILDNGLYALEVINTNGTSKIFYGKFSTVLEMEDNTYKFRTDASTNSELSEYEKSTAVTVPVRTKIKL